MSDSPGRKPYSRLPETFALMALVVGLDLVAMAWPVSNVSDFLLRTIGYSVMLTTATAHSWFFAQRALWTNASNAVATTFLWLVVLATGVFAIEWYAGSPELGWVAFTQIVLCSFLFSHATLRLTHFVAFLVMLVASTRLPLGIGGAAWVVFAGLSMLVLAYDRTARKAGPSGYDRGEARWPLQRLGVVSAVATISALLFLVTPMLRWPDFEFGRQPRTPPTFLDRKPPTSANDPFRIGGNTEAPDPGNDQLPVMNVRLNPAVGSPLYVRGQSFESFDGVSWANDNPEVFTIDMRPDAWTTLPVEQPSITPATVIQIRQSYEMLVDLEGVVFTAFRPASVRFADSSVDSVFVDGTGRTVRIDGTLAANSRYEVDGFQDVFAKGTLVRTRSANRLPDTYRNLQVPKGIDPQVKRIAFEQTAGLTADYDKAVALERYLRRNYFYSLSHDVGGEQVVNDFMLRTKRGHCALFASSMVVMARSVGLPARYVTGFLAQEQSVDGFLVRGSDGHAWVEVYIDGAGWLSFDPTSGTIARDDVKTQALTTDNGRRDVRVGDPTGRGGGGGGGGLYGRGDRDRDGGDPRNGDIARNDGGGGTGGGGSTGDGSTGGGSTGDGSTSGGDGTGPSGGGGTVDGGDLARNGDRQSGSAGTTDGSGTAGGSSGGGGSTTVIPPGGDTSLPQRGTGGSGGSNQGGGGNGSGTAAGTGEGSRGTGEAPSSGTGKPVDVKPAPKPDAVPDAKAVERDWSLLVWLLAGIGIIGLAVLGIWTFGVKRVTERRVIREALPLAVDDDPDPRRLIVKLYHAMVGGLGRVGFVQKEGTTPAEYAATVADREPSLAEPVGQMTELFHDARYDGIPVTRDQAEKARSVWRRIATSVKRVEPNAE